MAAGPPARPPGRPPPRERRAVPGRLPPARPALPYHRRQPGLRARLSAATRRPDHRTPQVLVITEPAAGQAEQFGRGNEAVADADRVNGDACFGTRDHPPVGVHGGMDHLFHPALALGSHHHPAEAQRHRVTQKPGPVVAPSRRRARLPGAADSNPSRERYPGAGPASRARTTFTP